jgi:hypothetical protein
MGVCLLFFPSCSHGLTSWHELHLFIPQGHSQASVTVPPSHVWLCDLRFGPEKVHGQIDHGERGTWYFHWLRRPNEDVYLSLSQFEGSVECTLASPQSRAPGI